MPYSQPGTKFTVPAATKAVEHGAPCVEHGVPGTAHKVEQLDAFTDPASAAATLIAIGEEFEINCAGVVEADRAAGLAAADVGASAVSDVYIVEADNTLVLAATALTAGAIEAGTLPYGKVVERDTSRTPQVLRINLDLRSLLVGVGRNA